MNSKNRKIEKKAVGFTRTAFFDIENALKMRHVVTIHYYFLSEVPDPDVLTVFQDA